MGAMKKEVLVTRPAVHAVADAIHAEGGRVSFRQVMRALGGGSNRDIGPPLREWKEKNKGSKIEASQSVPPEVERRFRESLHLLGDALRQEISGEFEVERRLIQGRIDEAIAESDDLSRDVADSEQEIAELGSRLNKASEETAALREQIQLAQAECVAEQDRRVLAEAREAEVRQRITELTVDRDSLRTELQTARQAVERQHREHQQATAKAAHLGGQVSSLQSELRRALDTLRQLAVKGVNEPGGVAPEDQHHA